MSKQTKGFCKYCGKEYTRGGMLRHLSACKKRKAGLESENEKTKCGYFELVILAKYMKEYWLIIEIRENATLNDLDDFIRDIWVECCGHLSAFEIDGVRYEECENMNRFWGLPAKSMNCKLKDVLVVGQSIEYEYDFGSTTELVIKVQEYRLGTGKEDKITLLSRNNPLEIFCSQCEKNKAQWVNPEGFYDGNPFWCESCMNELDEEADEYGCGEFLLPICNSPRMGVCGYEGSASYPDQFLPDDEMKNEGRSCQDEFNIENL